MEVKYSKGSRHKGNNIEKQIVYESLQPGEYEPLMDYIKEKGISKDDVNRLIRILEDINNSQNDFTTEFVKAVEERKFSETTDPSELVLNGVSFTSDLVTIMAAASSIVVKHPTLNIPLIMKTVLDMM